MLKYYRYPWTEDKVKELINWWPHFGTYGMAIELNLTRKQIKAKVNKLKLTLLPKNKRLCFRCKQQYQHSRHTGLYCNQCHLLKRRQARYTKERPLESWIREAVIIARHRSKTPCDLTVEHMVDLWNKQNGKCYYSNLPMSEPRYGSGKNPYVASMDRLDSQKGYTKDNVVWCCCICNSGKQQLSKDEYINLCSQVAHYQLGQLKSDHGK